MIEEMWQGPKEEVFGLAFKNSQVFFMFIGFYPHHLSFMSQATESSENYSNQSSPQSIRPHPNSMKTEQAAWKESAGLFYRNFSDQSATIKVRPPNRGGPRQLPMTFYLVFPLYKMGMITNLAPSRNGLL